LTLNKSKGSRVNYEDNNKEEKEKAKEEDVEEG